MNIYDITKQGVSQQRIKLLTEIKMLGRNRKMLEVKKTIPSSVARSPSMVNLKILHYR